MTHDEAANAIREALSGGPMYWSQLRSVLGWSVGKLQHHSDKMESENALFSKTYSRDGYVEKRVSLTPFQDEGETTTRCEKSERERVLEEIVKNLLDWNLSDIVDRVARFSSQISDVPEEFLLSEGIGAYMLDVILKKMEFTGIDDDRFKRLFGGNEDG